MSMRSIFRNASLKKASTITAVLFFRRDDEPSTSSADSRETVSSTSYTLAEILIYDTCPCPPSMTHDML